MPNGRLVIITMYSATVLLVSILMILSIQGVPFKTGVNYTAQLREVAQGTLSLATVNAKGTSKFNMTFIYIKPVGEYRVEFSVTGLQCNSTTYIVQMLGGEKYVFYNQTKVEFHTVTKNPVLAINVGVVVTGPCKIIYEPLVSLNITPVGGPR